MARRKGRALLIPYHAQQRSAGEHSIEIFYTGDVVIGQPLRVRNVVPGHQVMAIALVDWQRDTVGTWPHHIARIVAVTEAKGMANLMKADVVNHHVAHERIFSDAAPDSWAEPVCIRSDVD